LHQPDSLTGQAHTERAASIGNMEWAKGRATASRGEKRRTAGEGDWVAFLHHQHDTPGGAYRADAIVSATAVPGDTLPRGLGRQCQRRRAALVGKGLQRAQRCELLGAPWLLSATGAC